MSVIYHGTNHMVHAFRAGPCPANPFPAGTPRAAASGYLAESGGEELWAFVPFDQLSKLGERVKPQLRNPHTYVVAAPIRVTDIFVPGNFSVNSGGVNVSAGGVWRTVILFGRGIGGKHLTAIDVTNPGRFNESTLSAAIRPPIVMWSRGNPDTQSGSPTGVDYNNDAAGLHGLLRHGSDVVGSGDLLRDRGAERDDAPSAGRRVRGLYRLRLRRRGRGIDHLHPRHADR